MIDMTWFVLSIVFFFTYHQPSTRGCSVHSHDIIIFVHETKLTYVRVSGVQSTYLLRYETRDTTSPGMFSTLWVLASSCGLCGLWVGRVSVPVLRIWRNQPQRTSTTKNKSGTCPSSATKISWNRRYSSIYRL